MIFFYLSVTYRLRPDQHLPSTHLGLMLDSYWTHPEQGNKQAPIRYDEELEML